LIGAVSAGMGPERYVAAPLEDSLFSYSPGKSRWGKSESNLVRFAELARANKCSTLFLDPHADALERVKPYLEQLGVADRIIELSIAQGEARTQIGWNPFAKSNLVGEDAIGRQTQLITDSLASTMLESEAWRDQVVPHLSKRRRRFWEETFPKYPGEATTPITNFIERLAGVSTAAALLGSSESTYDLRSAIDSRKIILVRLRGGGQLDQMIASLVVNDLMKAVMSRTDIAPADRVPVHAWLDEVQTYDAAVKTQIASLLEETAKYGMRLHLLNQDPRALQERTLDAVVNNASHLLVTAVDAPKSAEWLSKALRKKVEAETVSSVRKYHGIAQTNVDGVKADPYRYRSIGLEEAYGPPPGDDASRAELQALIDRNSGRRPIAETLAALDTLDDRILEHLSGAMSTSRPAAGASNGSSDGLEKAQLTVVPARSPYSSDSVRARPRGDS